MVSYFHRMGFNTGFPDSRVDKVMSPAEHTYKRGTKFASHGGLEYLAWTHRERKTFDHDVEVIKDPWSNKSPRLLAERGVTFDNSLLMVRDPQAVAESTISFRNERGKSSLGSLRDMIKQAKVYTIEARQWLKENTNMIEVEFPRCITDFEYLWVTLQPLIEDRITKKKAKKEWKQLRNPTYVRH